MAVRSVSTKEAGEAGSLLRSLARGRGGRRPQEGYFLTTRSDFGRRNTSHLKTFKSLAP